MSEFTYVKAVNLGSFNSELHASAIGSKVHSVVLNGNVLKVTTTGPLSIGEELVLREVVKKHNPLEPIARAKMIDAMAFGQSIVLEVATENVLLKFDTNQVLAMLVKFSTIKAMLESGSLYTALSAMQAIKPDALMPQARIDKYVNKVKAYLEI